MFKDHKECLLQYPILSMVDRLTYCGTRPSSRRAAKKNQIKLFSLFLTSLLLQNVCPANSTIISTELREFADTQLLFWSGFDCVIDAALSFFGPIDEFIRETRDDPRTSEYSPPDELVETGGSLFENHTIFREAKTILSNIIRGVRPARCTDSFDGSPSAEQSEQSCSQSSSLQLAEKYVEDAQLNHSALQIRGGGRQKFEFSLFQNGDGSAEDPDGIPRRYIEMHSGNREKAAKSLASTLAWRAEHKIDTLLARSNPKFDACREVFPTSFLGRDLDGHVILLQRPAKINLELGQRNKIKKEDLLRHYIYMNEYLWQVLEADNPLGTMVSILDMSGLNMSILRKREYISFLKLFISVMESHFPQRAHKTLIVNAPKWFHTLYRVFSPVMREETKSKIEITSRSKKQDELLKRYLGSGAREKLPASFWNTNRKKRGRAKDHAQNEEDDKLVESDMDAKIRAHAVAQTLARGERMQVIV